MEPYAAKAARLMRAVERRENAPLNGELLRQRLLGRREIAPPNNPLERLAA